MPEWTPHETNTHQDHVIAHVIDTTVLGYFEAEEALHIALDIGFIWIIYLDGEMGLLPQTTALADLDLTDEERSALAAELAALHAQEDAGDEYAARVTRAPDGCRIEEVEFYARGDERRLLLRGEETDIAVETSPHARRIIVKADDAQA